MAFRLIVESFPLALVCMYIHIYIYTYSLIFLLKHGPTIIQMDICDEHYEDIVLKNNYSTLTVVLREQKW